ncbi:synaptotagmin-5 isoform X2 [Chelonus insularis]|nr:synaptotagmin-5 isoform X2 [Chelonus insularis]XP_034952106.1 synaptotagmin-5 isoform X2 [Chelonus insularis]XP_034952114.1 synaptotagmin-5 isoform X2 [Chelonus insularis]XP_034952122.1 synaptotagmin-5 isoform X2 [Chelonus insularis]XP_034952130.1 synaptotagmin-5 isoform X2 [Chelonus insularis]
MVSAAVLGAAAGTGLALVVAVTIVVYRYYTAKYLDKYWNTLDRWPDPPLKASSKEYYNISRSHHHSHSPPVASTVLDCWKKTKPNYYTIQPQEFNIAKEQHAVQPSSFTEGPGLPHQSRSYPSSAVSVQGPGGRVLARNPSISSQGSLEGASGTSSHRGSSPQIKAFGPDGRHHHDIVHASSSYPPSRSSRSPSPARAASLDARCSSPASFTSGIIHGGIGSPSQSSLSSIATGTSISGVSSNKPPNRCLSPLLIPPPRTSISDGGPTAPASPLGSLQPDLYQRQDGPFFLNAHCKTGRSMGRLHLYLSYDFNKSDLQVHLIEAHDLAGSDQGGFNVPFVKLTLSPEVDNKKRQTSIHRNNPNPFFDQYFRFPVSCDELKEKTLTLQVFDYDRYSRNDVVGSLRVVLEELELASSASPVEVWGEIIPEKKPPEEIQEVLVTLSYLPGAERLKVLILKARNLFPSEKKETLDPFVKVTLLSGDKRVKKKTKVKKGTRCPVWNEEMAFNVSSGSLASSAIEVCVMDASSELGGNTIVGSCIVGPSTGGNLSGVNWETGNRSQEHWTKITQSPRKSVTMWHTLH